MSPDPAFPSPVPPAPPPVGTDALDSPVGTDALDSPVGNDSLVLRRALPWLAGAVALTAGIGVFTSTKYAKRKEQLERRRIGRTLAVWGPVQSGGSGTAAGTDAPTPIPASGSVDPFLPLLILGGMLSIVAGTAFALWRAGAAADREPPPSQSLPAPPSPSAPSVSQEPHS